MSGSSNLNSFRDRRQVAVQLVSYGVLLPGQCCVQSWISHWRFKRLINNISHEKNWTRLRKWNLKRETESLLMAAQNSAIRTNHIKARIDKTQQNSKCCWCSDKDKTINHIICECSKLAQKECKTRHNWVSKVIHWVMCKKFKFDHANNWYMHNPASILVYDTQTPMGLWRADGLPILDPKNRHYNNQPKKKKKENLQNCWLWWSGLLHNKTKIMWKEGNVPRPC